MITDPQGTIIALFLAICRIGACFMTMPGFSSSRIPGQIRILVCVAVTMALLPVLWGAIYPNVSGASQGTIVGLIFTEILIGAMYGLIARFYTLGLQFTGAIIGASIGFSAPGGADVIEDVQENQISNFITFGSLLVLFMLDFHHVVLRALVDSYTATPVGALISSQKMLITLTDTLRASTTIMLRLASPFIIYGLMFNVAVGLINKLAPQIPVYFISTPFVLAGGLFMLYLSVAALVRQFVDGFGPVFIGF
ncbi:MULTISPECIES: flagellar biosynthetic protein FliR [Rhizobium/Agrobacterium group]|uniref:flagellar biosynthetic protein FliR n=1 Tax=Rhizobium/Agrobacterium group TaxID=227290 RepID=UPI00110EB83C|nr:MULTISPECIES: flagellar biosynthetic protein FliR [Rhizobium/Agrobacterium group]NWJ24889.1 flagellar type III secretion system protein FliR [Rhizobium sp. RM]TMV16676.1 flagellar type III secretion system protein FliR [Rhizobium sp. Td3]UXS00274.1 flagellar type III secretion system protein FliR [Agrobacterium tumefaciens]